MKDNAVKNFQSGYSCSESIIKAAIDEGLCDANLLSAATSFSGGCSSGCICGAVAASLMIIGNNFGRDNQKGNDVMARNLSAQFMEKFKNIHKVTCCKVLSKGLEGQERKNSCTNLVYDCAIILEELLKVKV